MIIPPGFAQVNYIFGGAALPTRAEVTFGVNQADGMSASQVAQAAHDAWVAQLDAVTVTAIALTSTRAKLGPNEVGDFFEVSSNNAGAVAGTSVPPNCALLVKKVTSSGGKKGRGRLYYPGIPEAQVDQNGTILSGQLTTYQTAFTAWLAALATANIPMVLLHNDATLPTAVTALQVQIGIATQRRRLRK